MMDAVLKVEPVQATRIELQPGDATRYVFLCLKSESADEIAVIDENHGGIIALPSFLLERVWDRAFDVVNASYRDYQSLATDNQLVLRLFDNAPEGWNPWTYLAAIVAVLRARL